MIRPPIAPLNDVDVEKSTHVIELSDAAHKVHSGIELPFYLTHDQKHIKYEADENGEGFEEPGQNAQLLVDVDQPQSEKPVQTSITSKEERKRLTEQERKELFCQLVQKFLANQRKAVQTGSNSAPGKSSQGQVGEQGLATLQKLAKAIADVNAAPCQNQQAGTDQTGASLCAKAPSGVRTVKRYVKQQGRVPQIDNAREEALWQRYQGVAETEQSRAAKIKKFAQIIDGQNRAALEMHRRNKYRANKVSQKDYLPVRIRDEFNALPSNPNVPVLMVLVKINGRTYEAQLDTGATTSLVNETIAAELRKQRGVSLLPPEERTVLRDVQNKEIPQLAPPISVPLTMGSVTRAQPLYVTELDVPLLLGLDTFYRFKLVVDMTTSPARIQVNPNQVPYTPHHVLCRVGKGLSSEPAALWVESEALPIGRSVVQLEFPSICTGQVILKKTSRGLTECDEQLLVVENHLSKAYVDNFDDDFRTQRGKELGNYEVVESDDLIVTRKGVYRKNKRLPNNAELEVVRARPNPKIIVTAYETKKQEQRIRFIEAVEDEIDCPSLPIPPDPAEPKVDWEENVRRAKAIAPEHHDKLISILRKYPGVVAKHEFDFGKLAPSMNFKYDIDTGDAPAVAQRPYKLSPIRAAQVKRALDEYEKHGLIELGESNWATPVFVIKKADGRLRITYDCRRLNSVTVPSTFPLPRLDTIFDHIGQIKGKILSLLDLKAAYNSVEMTERAAKKAAIIVPWATYLIKRLGFGYANAPSSFSFLIYKVLSSIPKKWDYNPYYGYIDDITVISRTAEEHWEQLELLFETLNKAGLKLMPWKLQLFQKEINLLGRTIDATGVKPLARDCAAVDKLKIPETKKDVQKLVGFLNWLSPYIYKFAEKTLPITRLLRSKTAKVEWGEEQQQALDDLKENIKRRVKVYHVDYDSPIYVNTDASGVAIAAWLYQVKRYTKEEFEEIAQKLQAGEELSEFPKSKSLDEQHPILPRAGKGLAKLAPLKNENPYIPTAAADQDVEYMEEDNKTNQGHHYLILPVAFFSQTLDETQARWTSMEQEVYSVVKVVQRYQDLLLTTPKVYILSDNAVFIWACHMKRVSTPKIQRWVAYLFSLPFSIVVTHVAGQFNSVPDYLSRPRAMYVLPKTELAIEIESPFVFGQVITRKTR